MNFQEYRQHDALGLADLVHRGEVSPAELLKLAMGRADATHAQINAVIRRFDERASARAGQVFSTEQPFAGVPFLVKDLFQELEGEPCAWGVPQLATHKATFTADVVRRWEHAGAVIFGSTNTPQFGAKGVTEPDAYGPTRNPWDLSCTPGGSSGGSAAAVAAGVVPVAGAGDGGGSIRIPAACTGLFGLKAGRGRVSFGPSINESFFGATVAGVISRSVRDSAAMLDVLQGPEAHAPYWMAPASPSWRSQLETSPQRLRIGFCSDSPTGTPVNPLAVQAMEDAARLCTSLGHHVEPVALPFDGKQVSADFLTAWFCKVAMLVAELGRTHGLRPRDFEPDTQVMAAVGRSVSAPELLCCLERWAQHTRDISRFHERFDLWLSPTLSAPPPPIGALATPPLLHQVNALLSALGLFGLVRKTSVFEEMVLKNMAWTPYTQMANITGRPAMSVPLFWTPQGLPLGVQFVGGLGSEGLLLRLARELEQARPWFDRTAPL